MTDWGCGIGFANLWAFVIQSCIRCGLVRFVRYIAPMLSLLIYSPQDLTQGPFCHTLQADSYGLSRDSVQTF